MWLAFCCWPLACSRAEHSDIIQCFSHSSLSIWLALAGHYLYGNHEGVSKAIQAKEGGCLRLAQARTALLPPQVGGVSGKSWGDVG